MDYKKLNEDIFIEVLNMHPTGVKKEECIKEYSKRLGLNHFTALRTFLLTLNDLRHTGKVIVMPGEIIKISEC